jgi:DNA-directed RNA polymerase sigma subunit (sigma70/sigma32)
LALTEPAEVWHDRLRDMKAMRAQGQTLAAIGERFGLSAERVRQILHDA